MEINDDSLYSVYMTDKNITENDIMFNFESSKFYYIGEDAYLFISKEKEHHSFEIFNMNYKQTFIDPIQVIRVNQDDGSISFLSMLDNSETLKIKAEFDRDHYDVRSYVDTPRKPTYLKEALEDLDEVEKEGFTNLIQASMILAETRKENKRNR